MKTQLLALIEGDLEQLSNLLRVHLPSVAGRARDQKALYVRRKMFEVGGHPPAVDGAVAPVVRDHRTPQCGHAAREQTRDQLLSLCRGLNRRIHFGAVGAFSAERRRTLMLRSAAVVCQVARPNGTEYSISPGRSEIFLPTIDWSTNLSLSIQASILVVMTRSRMRYQRSLSNGMYLVVSFSEAS